MKSCAAAAGGRAPAGAGAARAGSPAAGAAGVAGRLAPGWAGDPAASASGAAGAGEAGCAPGGIGVGASDEGCGVSGVTAAVGAEVVPACDAGRVHIRTTTKATTATLRITAAAITATLARVPMPRIFGTAGAAGIVGGVGGVFGRSSGTMSVRGRVSGMAAASGRAVAASLGRGATMVVSEALTSAGCGAVVVIGSGKSRYGPIATTTPGASVTRESRCPSTHRPFWLCWSTSTAWPASSVRMAWTRDTAGSSSTISHCLDRPILSGRSVGVATPTSASLRRIDTRSAVVMNSSRSRRPPSAATRSST